MKIKIITCLAAGFLCLFAPVYPQGSAGDGAPVESRFIVDMPTAGLIHKGSYSVSAIAFPGGGLLAELNASPWVNFNFGISYSATNVIGTGKLTWQNLPGINLRYRALDETARYPALLLGFSNQGRGSYIPSKKRFNTYSPGLYASLSKNFRWALGTIALHGGAGYSFEPPPDTRCPNIYLGIEQSVSTPASINIEYNANFDDRDVTVIERSGLLNAALRLSVIDGLTIELQARDILGNHKNADGFERFFGIEFVRKF